MKAFIGMTCWIADEGTVHVMIGIGMGAENFATGGSFFAATSLVSLDSQKKENSEDSDFGCRDIRDEVISFTSSASGSQKKERSETSFVHGVAGDETIFLGGAIQRVTIC